MESILTSIKKLLGLDADYDHFNQDITIHINTAFMSLNQLGVGPPEGFFIESKAQQWQDFLGPKPNYEGVKTYVYLKVRLVFDPPGNSFLIESINSQIKELEWRLRDEAERELLKVELGKEVK